MTDPQKLSRDINTLRESIRLDYAELEKLGLTSVERAGLRKSIAWYTKELAELLRRDSA